MSVVPTPVQAMLETVSAPAIGGDPKAQEATPETTQPDPKKESISKHFAALAKKEKLLFREREALNAEKAAIAAERARIAELEAKYGTKPATPKEALERYGFDYKTATEFELNDNAPTAEYIARQAEERVRKLEEAQKKRDEEEKLLQAQRIEQEKAELIEDFKTEIGEFIEEKADDYELIKFHNAQGVVFDTIEQHHQRTGKLLSIPEAANLVEKFLEKRLEDLKSTKKFLKRQEEGQPPKPESGFRSQLEVTAPKRTLDNSTTTASTPSLMKSARFEDDRMKRALAALDRR